MVYFWKVDPTSPYEDIALSDFGFVENDIFLVRITGDFRPTNNPNDTEYYKDAFQNSSATYDGDTIGLGEAVFQVKEKIF